MRTFILTVILPLSMAMAAGGAAAQAPDVPVVASKPGAASTRSVMLDAARAGKRIVAVGERGHVLLSDDDGATFRQAAGVPLDLTLTSVSFVDDKEGWAAGHGGVIMRTGDGGEHWDLQHRDTAADQPLFSVYFRDREHGWASGLWSLLLATADGGKTWTRVQLPTPAGQKRADLNLLQVFEGGDGHLFISAEQGAVLASADGGATWSYQATGGAASLWAGTAGEGATAIVAGLRGKIFRSGDGGASWQAVVAPVEASITHLAREGATFWAGTVSGAVLCSTDDGRHWQVVQRYPSPVTAMLPLGGGRLLAFSKQGVLRPPEQGNAGGRAQ